MSESINNDGQLSDWPTSDGPEFLSRIENDPHDELTSVLFSVENVEPPAPPKPTETSLDNQGHALFGGGDPLKDFFFGTFFTKMIEGGFTEDKGHYKLVRNTSTKAVLAGYGYAVARRFLLIFLLLTVLGSAAGNMASAVPLIGQLGMTEGLLGFLGSMVVVGSGILLIDLLLGVIFNFGTGELRATLANDISGCHTRRFRNATDEFNRIYSEKSKYYQADGSISAEWVRAARNHFLEGHKEAKRLKSLEIYTIIQMRRVSAHYALIDLFAFVTSIAIFGWFLFVVFDQPTEGLIISRPLLIGAGALAIAYFFFRGSKRNDIFSRYILDQMLTSGETYDKFNLKQWTAQIIQHDQAQISQAVNNQRRG